MTLKEYIDQHKVYLNPVLSIDDLIRDYRKASGDTRCIQVVNYTFKIDNGKTIMRYINHKRIDQAQIVFKKYPAVLMADWYKWSGFNSRGAFEFWFKKVINDTPGLYRMKNRYSVS